MSWLCDTARPQDSICGFREPPALTHIIQHLQTMSSEADVCEQRKQ